MSILTKEIWDKKLFNGAWQSASQTYNVVEVATGHGLGEIGYASVQDVVDAAQQAKIAQQQWWALSYQERQAVFERAANLLTENQAEVIEWLVKESGSLQLKAGFEVSIAIQVLKHCIALPAADQGTLLPTQNGKLSIAKRVPLGVIGVISPFNFPLYLLKHFLNRVDF